MTLANFIIKKTDPFNAYASVIDSIANLRFTWYQWSFERRRCEEPSIIAKFLYYAQVTNQFVFCFICYLSFVWYFQQEENIRISVVISDGLILTGFTYGFLYQVSSLRYGREVEFHVNQQIQLHKEFAAAMKIPLSDKWNHGIFYLFCQMCNMTRPNFGFGCLPYFLKKDSPLSVYYRLGGEQWSLGFYLYALWSTYTLEVTYVITNYYAILALGHTAFNSYWLKLMRNRIMEKPTVENQTMTAKLYRRLQILNALYHPAYGKMILPTVIIFASAWVVLAMVVLFRLLDDMEPIALLMILTAASQAVGFLSLKFYFSHCMKQHSEEYLLSRNLVDGQSSYWRRVGKAMCPIGVRVGGFYMISIEDLQVWADALVSYILLLLGAF